MEPTTYRASLLPALLSVETHQGIESEWDAPQFVKLHVGYVSEKLRTRDFWGSSLRESVIACQSVFDFNSVSLAAPDGAFSFQYFPARLIVDSATDEAISFRATLDNNVLHVHSVEDQSDEEQDYIRLMVLDIPGGKREIHCGESLMKIVAEIRRFHVVQTVRVIDQPPRRKTRIDCEPESE
jgi:hypothetical protein